MSTAAVTEGIFDLLSGSASLAALITQFKGSPAVFMFDEAPEKAVLPYVQSRGVADFPSARDLDGGLRDVSFTVEAFAEALGDPLPVDGIADAVAELFRRPTSLSIAGFKVVNTVVDGPIVIETDPDTYGRSVAVRCLIYPT